MEMSASNASFLNRSQGLAWRAPVVAQPILFLISGDPMKLRPLGDRVIVKRVDSETKTASGIVIPDAAAEKPDQGEVLAVGPGKKNDKGEIAALNVKVGDRVLFGKYSGQTVKVDGDELLVMKEDDLFAVVEK
jgi:chaperonin GroES